MAFTNLLHLVSLITLLTGISCTPPWDANVGRYDSYNLAKGPVFYEAYYPESNESPPTRGEYQEKRYFDHGAVRERSFQIPTGSYEYSDESGQVAVYPDRIVRSYVDVPDPPIVLSAGNDYFHERPRNGFQGENFADPRTPDAKDYSLEEPRLFTLSEAEEPNDYSSLLRRVPREFENRNSLGYVERTKQHPRSLYIRPDLQVGGYDTIDRSIRRVDLRPQLSSGLRREAGRQNRIEMDSETVNSGDRVGREFDSGYYRLPNSLDYQRRKVRYVDEVDLGSRQQEDRMPTNDGMPDSVRASNNMPVENIFEPRPQVINYVFSKSRPIKFEEETRKKVLKAEAVEDESTPRNYGDNIAREEMKKANAEREEAKVTSIEVSEVPRHKTRHHHGELPKRDYSHRHRA